MNLTPLTQKLSKHFSLHPSRQKTLAAMMLGALCSSNVHHQSLARYVDSPNPKAAVRRIERFFLKKPCLPRSMQQPSLLFLALKENLIFVLIGLTGSLVIKTLTTSS